MVCHVIFSQISRPSIQVMGVEGVLTVQDVSLSVSGAPPPLTGCLQPPVLMKSSAGM